MTNPLESRLELLLWHVSFIVCSHVDLKPNNGTSKFTIAMDFLSAMNNTIPDLNINGALWLMHRNLCGLHLFLYINSFFYGPVPFIHRQHH